MKKRDKKLLEQLQTKQKSSFSLKSLIIFLIGALWYAVESNYIPFEPRIYFPIGVVILGILLLILKL